MRGGFVPGDVAWGGDYEHRMLRTKKGWVSSSGYTCGEWTATELRPLVVIDPEDREQVEVLALAYWGPETIGHSSTDRMQAALRSLIADPKPDEPQGLGAVVEDERGRLWFRMTVENQTWPGEVWQPQYDSVDRWSTWVDIAAVRVLSEGVTQ